MPPKSYQCGGCDRLRVESRFSNNAIRKYEQALANARRAKAYAPRNNATRSNSSGDQGISGPDQVLKPRCMECTAGPVHELKCNHCDVVKGLESFSKQMRRNPDNALCLNCSQDRQDLEPRHQDQVQEEIAMDRLRVGATVTNLGTGSTAIGYGTNSHSPGRSNGLTDNTNADAASEWYNDPIPIPHDPRPGPDSSSNRSGPASVATHSIYSANMGATSETAWADFERTQAPYREQGTYRRASNSTNGNGGLGAGFVKQGAVRPDTQVKAQNSLARQQLREVEQAEQAALRDSDDDSSGDDDDDDDPY